LFLKKNKMVSHSHKFIFVHINRTGGSSIEKALKDFGGIDNCPEGNFTRHDLSKTLSNLPYWNDYFKFTFVRNPWDKECSDYYWHQKLFKRGSRKNCAKTFEDYFELPEQKHNNQWHSNQLEWLFSHDGKMEIDFIGRFENLQADFNEVCKKIKIDPFELPHKNNTKKKNYKDLYTEDLVDKVRYNYRYDINYFKYKFK